MNKETLTIDQYMSKAPHTIGGDQTLDRAEKMMRELRVRHLPVLSGGKLIGILSDRDIKLVETLRDVDPAKVTVDEAFTPEPYIASPKTTLKEVVDEMATRKFGCALVCDHQKLVGIFTWIDALKAMSELVDKKQH